MPLILERTKAILASDLILANTLWSRGIGLLGKREFPFHQALWIEDCNSIHTCFMAFAIDVIYVNQNSEIVKILRDLKPWRFSFAFGAKSVIEWKSGALDGQDLQLGDKLIVER